MCCSHTLDGSGSELRWSQGKVTLVSNGSNMLKGSKSAQYGAGETVMISWDACPERGEPATVSAQPKWNPKGAHTAGGVAHPWRFGFGESPVEVA